MKHPPKTSYRSEPGTHSRGFALIVALSLLSICVLVLVSIATLLRVEQQAAGQQSLKLQARQNTFLALQEALGEVQKLTGPDQRVTATGEILSETIPGKRKLTGVWDTRKVFEDGSQNPNYGSVIGWLSSGALQTGSQTFNESGMAADTQLLVSARHEGTSKEILAVEAIRRNLPKGGNRSGEYAWWALDESVKARANLPADPLAASASDEDSYATFLSPRGFGTGELVGLESIGDGIWGKIFSLGQLDLAQMGSGTTDPTAGNYFHDLGFSAKGVLANVRDGGLKTDLTTAFQYDTIFDRDIANLDADGDGRNERMEILSSDLPEFDPASGWDFIGVPEMSILRSYWQMPSHDAGQLTVQRRLYEGKNHHRMDGNVGWFTQGGWLRRASYASSSPVTPLVASYQFGFGFRFDFKQNEVSGELEHEKSFTTIQPFLVFYNPYNLTLEQNDDEEWRVSLDLPRVLIKVTREPEDGSAPITASLRLSELFVNPRMQGQNWNTGLRLKVSSSEPVSLDPGELRVYAPGISDWGTPNFNGWRFMTSDFSPHAAWRMLIDTTYPIYGGTYTAKATVDGPTALTHTNQKDAYEDVDNRWTTDEDDANKFGLTDSEEAVFQPSSPNDLITVEVIFDEETMGSVSTAGYHLSVFRGEVDQDVEDRYMHRFGRMHNPKTFATTTSITKRASAWDGAIDFGFKFSLRSHDEFTRTPGGGVTDPDSDTVDEPLRQVTRALIDGNPRAFAPSAVGEGLVEEVDGGVRAPTTFSYVMEAADTSTNAQLLQVNLDPDQPTARGSVMFANSLGLARLPLFDVPRFHPVSLASMQHAMISFFSHHPTYAVGNSYAPMRIPDDEIVYEASPQHVFEDLSYLANEHLYDRYFFSTVPPDSESDEFESILQGESLFNERIGVYPEKPGTWTPAQFLDPDEPNSARSLAARLMIDGPFNVNSTSVDAWKALLASMGGVSAPVADEDAPAEAAVFTDLGGAYFSRFERPYGTAFYEGLRMLDLANLDALAQAIVSEVKERGPFLNLADFVNRDPTSTDATNRLMGPLQEALDLTVNADDAYVVSGATPPESVVDGFFSNIEGPENIDPVQAAGFPGWLMQADLLQRLDPILTVRGDTFTIRTYGCVRGAPTQEILAEAWCEAVVQRVPEALGAPHDDHSELVDPSSPFGRQYRVVRVRWLSEEEI